jgi:virginiamycin B lyase
VDPDRFELEEYTSRPPTRGCEGIALGAQGGIWYVDYARAHLPRLDPRTPAVKEWPASGGAQSLSYAMAADDRGRLWAGETGPQPNRLVGFDPERGSPFAKAASPSGGGTVRHMVFEPRRRQLRSGTDHDTIRRASVP